MKDLDYKARLLKTIGDPTRMRILCHMFKAQEDCVSHIAEALDLSVANTSHHLHVMKELGIFKTQRQGVSICYILQSNAMLDHLEHFVCKI